VVTTQVTDYSSHHSTDTPRFSKDWIKKVDARLGTIECEVRYQALIDIIALFLPDLIQGKSAVELIKRSIDRLDFHFTTIGPL